MHKVLNVVLIAVIGNWIALSTQGNPFANNCAQHSNSTTFKGVWMEPLTRCIHFCRIQNRSLQLATLSAEYFLKCSIYNHSKYDLLEKLTSDTSFSRIQELRQTV